jgi:tRNA/rRNA methyltransferase
MIIRPVLRGVMTRWWRHPQEGLPRVRRDGIARAMSVEDQSQAATGQPAFVLVRPQMGENIGAAARAMWNFGLDRMRVVAPRDGWPNERAVALASGAGRLLDHAGLCADVPEAISDSTYVYATTARERGLTKPIVTPERAMIEAREMIARGGKVAVLFGPERAGLENPDIARANAIISVPVNPDFPSLNLAQCVLLCAYEWRRATVETPQAVMELARTEFATGAEITALGDHFEERLDAAGFFFPEEKAAGMKLNLRNLWGRLSLTRADVQTLHGMMRQMVRWAGRGDR